MTDELCPIQTVDESIFLAAYQAMIADLKETGEYPGLARRGSILVQLLNHGQPFEELAETAFAIEMRCSALAEYVEANQNNGWTLSLNKEAGYIPVRPALFRAAASAPVLPRKDGEPPIFDKPVLERLTLQFSTEEGRS